MLTVGGAAPGRPAESHLDPRLKPAAHEFEACLMKEFLKPLEDDTLSGAGAGNATDEDGGEGSDSALMSFGTEALAKAISERGGLGIADKILAHFDGERQGETSKAGGI